ncbi:hypothetical protein [Algoriphagus litoralis]|uniref:hypothetical protein n=1 Tax=Algoriphagus litoralis TaxID=2202829 RepID=UPI0013003BBF|nr:hypothetical protein [Algoriphagus litoralis]
MKSPLQILSNWKILLLLFALVLLANFLLGQFMPKEQALDLKFAYSAKEAYDSILQLDENGLKRYRFGILALDMPYILIYGLFFSGVMFKLWGRPWTILIPISIMVLDFFENVMVLEMLGHLPEQHLNLGSLASIFTTGKWIFVSILGLSILSGLIRNLFFKK